MQPRENPWRHLALLISILLLFTVNPLVVTFRHGVLILNIIAATVLVAGTYTLSERKHLFTIAVALSAISILATWLLLVFPRRWLMLVSHTTIIVLIAFSQSRFLATSCVAVESPLTKSLPPFASIC